MHAAVIRPDVNHDETEAVHPAPQQYWQGLIMTQLPSVDVNLLAYNAADTVGAAIESVLAQTWPEIRITLIDDGSSDGTADIVADFQARYPRIQARRNRRNGGAVANFQRAFWTGDADFVMPKSSDDMIAPDFVAKTMAVLLANPSCVMCHAAGLVFTGNAEIRALYQFAHCLNAIEDDPVLRARHVMARYTSSPSFWGVYRRDAVDRLARIRHRAGWDHAWLAELALYGEIRHVPEALYWRRDGGKPVSQLARASTERGSRGLDVNDLITEPHWRMPLTTTALAHLEVFAISHVTTEQRNRLWQAVPEIFRARWLPMMQHEAATLEQSIPGILAAAQTGSQQRLTWILRDLSDLLHAVALFFPERNLRDVFGSLDFLRDTLYQPGKAA